MKYIWFTQKYEALHWKYNPREARFLASYGAKTHGICLPLTTEATVFVCVCGCIW